MPHLPPLPSLVPGVPNPERVLDAAVRLGLSTVEQLAALVDGARPVEVGSTEIRRAEQAVQELRRRGLVETIDLVERADPLPRRRGRELFRSGRLPETQERWDLGIYAVMALDTVRAARAGVDGVALRQALIILRPEDLEQMLSDLVERGLLRRSLFRPDDQHVLVQVTRAGYRHWARRSRALEEEPIMPPKRPPSVHRLHHILTVEAALEVMAGARGRFVGFSGDGDLRARMLAGRPIRRRGKHAAAAMSVGPVPDGEIAWRGSGGQVQTARIEVLTSSYTEDMMRVKAAVSGVLVFTSSVAAARRAEKAGLRGVRMLDGRLPIQEAVP